MILADFQMAYASFKATKIRSALTVIGISVGVASIVLVYALGKGLEYSVSQGSSKGPRDVITVSSGKLITKNSSGRIKSLDISALIGSSTLTEKDVSVLNKVQGVEYVAPLAVLAGSIETESLGGPTGNTVVASTAEIRKILDKRLKFGDYFSEDDSNRNIAIIGSKSALDLFQEESPIGRMFTFRGSEFVVKGVFEDFGNTSSTLGFNYNKMIVIPLDTAKRVSGGLLEIREIQVKKTESSSTEETINAIEEKLLENHKNQNDFSVYAPGDYSNMAGQLFSYITVFITSIAGISLFVGGVGIMNIMFVSVTERTKEIGVRKALGATSRQIYGQFLVESVILSTLGGIFGLIVALSAGYLISIRTSLSPSFELVPVALSMLLAIATGTVFGIAPAIKAARQDPIKSLRHH